MSTSPQTDRIDRPARALATALGATSRIKIVHLLATADGPVRQYELAEALDISEAAVSRSKTFLADGDLIIESADGLTLRDQIEQNYLEIYEAVRDT